MEFNIREPLLAIGWRSPWIRALSSYRPVILLYHGVLDQRNVTDIDAKTFEMHILLLRRHFEIVSLTSIQGKRKVLARIRVVLTFDDGFRNNAEIVAPILRKHNVPATFFVCSRHSDTSNYLWFSYLRALEEFFRGSGFHFRGRFIDMSSDRRRGNIQRLGEVLLSLKPHPVAMYEAIEKELPHLEDFVSEGQLQGLCAGMTKDQIAELAADPLFSIGAHTVDHPFLTKCEPDEAYRQIRENKDWIERVSGRSCNVIAYPSGDYNETTLEQCRSLGFVQGHAVIPVAKINSQLELPRLGIYSTSLDILGFKVQWGNLMRTFGVKVG